MIRLRSEITYVSYLGLTAARIDGQIRVRGRVFVQPAAGGYMVTRLDARQGLPVLLPSWMGMWDESVALMYDRSGAVLERGQNELVSDRAGTFFFGLDFPDHGLPFHLFSVRVTLVEGRQKVCKKLVRVRPNPPLEPPAADTADSRTGPTP